MGFLDRLEQACLETDQATLLIADAMWGAPYLFEHIAKREGLCIWIGLGPEDADDPVAQGNSLADAVSRALGSPLFGHGMAYTYGLAVLGQHLGLFEPLTVLLSGAEHGEGLAAKLLDFQRPGTQVVVAFETLPRELLIPENVTVLLKDDLTLREAEAVELVRGRLEEVETLNLWRLSQGAYERFLLGLHERLALPPKLRPGPVTSELPPGAQQSIDPAVMLSLLGRRGNYLEALEVASEHLPERVPDLLDRAGEAYLERGLYQRLWTLLERLPESLHDDERVLTWQARSAKRLGQHGALRPRIERYLEAHEAPDLRALYASFIARERGYKEVQRAYEVAKTPTTLQHYGLALVYQDPEKSLDVFRELIDLTKRQGSASEQVRATMMMGLPLILLGRYRESMVWLEQAITAFDEQGVGDWQARMHMINNWAYTRILIGETVGLGELLQAEAKALHDAYPARTISFRATLGDYYLSQGQAERALEYYEENLGIFEAAQDTKSIDFPPSTVRDVVHCLLHLGELERAATLAAKYYYLSRQAGGFEPMYGSLAQGMVLALTRPDEAVPMLKEAADALAQAYLGDHLVSACFYLARAQLSLDQEEGARAALERCASRLEELSDTGFRLLAGPEAQFREVRRLFQGDEVPLKLSFLGDSTVTLRGDPLEFYPQWLEVLALLALHPEGLSGEQLLILLYEDEGSLSTLKSTLSKIRRSVPLTRPPYRIDLPFQADFLELEQALRQGRLRAGLELYKGPLLPDSDAPGVTDVRDTLEESLRQAALASNDPEVLVSLAERLEGDLELWEAALAALPSADPRHSVASAKHKKLLETW